MVLFIIVSVTPVLSVTLEGTRTQVNVWRAAIALAHGWISLAAAALALVTFLIPLLQILLLTWVLAFARIGMRAPGSRWVIRTLQAVRPWSMTEVFMLGALVAIFKLSAWFPVSLGPGIWALAGLTVILAVLDLREVHGAWRLFEQLPA
jgi:paraquat-inducible protein A